MAEHPGVRIEEIAEEDVESVPVSRTASAPIVQEPDDEEEESTSKPTVEEDDEEQEGSGSESDNDESDGDESYEEDDDDDDDDDDFFGFGSDMMSMLDGFGLFGKRGRGAEKTKKMARARRGPGGGVYECYSSSSVVSTGADGKTRVRETTAATRRLGHGVAETQRSVRDSGTGVARLTLQRRLGTRARTVEQARGRDGAVHTRETLHGVAPRDAAAFDRAFVAAAARADAPAAKRLHASTPALEDAAAALRRRGRSRRHAIAVDEEPLEGAPDVVVVPDDTPSSSPAPSDGKPAGSEK